MISKTIKVKAGIYDDGSQWEDGALFARVFEGSRFFDCEELDDDLRVSALMTETLGKLGLISFEHQ